MDIPTWSELIEFVQEQMKTNQWFQTVGFFGVLSFIGIYFKNAFLYLWRRIERKITYSATIEQTDPLYFEFEKWLSKNHTSSYRNIWVTSTYSKLKYLHLEDLFFIWRRGVPLKIEKGREKLENANQLNNLFFNRFKISGIFAKHRINSLLNEVLDYSIHLKKEEKKHKVTVFVNNGDWWQRISDIVPKPINNIIIEDKDKLIADMDKFVNNRQWYEDRSIMYKRGYMFYGKAGNGKTSLALSLAKHFDKDLHVITINKMLDDEKLTSLFRHINSNSILLIEDIDAVFNETRKKKSKDISFNFSTLLNCLDGVFSVDGIVTIFTTNHPERLDAALIRAGRMDYKFEITNPSGFNIIKYLRIFYADSSTEIDIEHLSPEDNHNLPMVKVQDICLRNPNSLEDAVKEIKRILKKGH